MGNRSPKEIQRFIQREMTVIPINRPTQLLAMAGRKGQVPRTCTKQGQVAGLAQERVLVQKRDDAGVRSSATGNRKFVVTKFY